MADNVAITPGAGATVAADDIGGGVLAQRIKVGFGADGSYSDAAPDNPLPVTEAVASSRAMAAIAASAASVTLAAARTARKGLIVTNDSTNILYLAYSTTAATSAYSVKVAAGGYWEMPPPVWNGAVSGIWDGTNGSAQVTETY